jgi:hypothetical protein
MENLSPGVKWFRLETDHSPPSSAESKNVSTFFREHRLLSLKIFRRKLK